MLDILFSFCDILNGKINNLCMLESWGKLENMIRLSLKSGFVE